MTWRVCLVDYRRTQSKMPRPPSRNIFLLCADQYRGDMLRANGLNKDIRTPNLDALARRGTLFRRHFTTFPKCVPARVSMMTGRYTHTDGYRDITQHLPAGTPDVASTLKAAGYELAEFGRNHCWEHMLEASHRPPQLEDGQRGLAFDHHAWTEPFNVIWQRHQSRKHAMQRKEPATLEDGRGFVFEDDRGWTADEAVVEMADVYLNDVRDRGRPFFCQVNLGKPHTPYETDLPWLNLYDRDKITLLPHDLPSDPPICAERQRAVRTGFDVPDATLRAVQATYMAMCSRVDDLLGRVIESLERSGAWDETIIVFTSDHGDYAGQYGLVEKWDTHFPDALMHVPMILVGGDLPAGEVTDALTDHSDLAPTLCELAGVEPFDGIHGTRMTARLDGSQPRQAVFADGGHEAAARDRFNQYEATGQATPTTTPHDFQPRPHTLGLGNDKQETCRLFPDTMARAKMVRTDRWKLVHRETGDHELYDLAADRFEMTNLYRRSGHESIKLELMSLLLDWTLRTDPDRPPLTRVGA